MFWEKCFCIFHITVFGSLFSCTCIKTLPGVRVPDLCSLPFAFINLIKFHFFFFFSFSCYIVFAICILCFIKPKLGSHLSKCSLKSWRLWGKLVHRAKFSIKFWRCRAEQGGREEGGGYGEGGWREGRGENKLTTMLQIVKFNEKTCLAFNVFIKNGPTEQEEDKNGNKAWICCICCTPPNIQKNENACTRQILVKYPKRLWKWRHPERTFANNSLFVHP